MKKQLENQFFLVIQKSLWLYLRLGIVGFLWAALAIPNVFNGFDATSPPPFDGCGDRDFYNCCLTLQINCSSTHTRAIAGELSVELLQTEKYFSEHQTKRLFAV